MQVDAPRAQLDPDTGKLLAPWPAWARESCAKSKVQTGGRARGGCTGCTKPLYPGEWLRLIAPFAIFVLYFGSFFTIKMTLLLSDARGNARGSEAALPGSSLLFSSDARAAGVESTFFSQQVEWIGVILVTLCSLMTVWSMIQVHYTSPGFVTTAFTQRAVALSLLGTKDDIGRPMDAPHAGSDGDALLRDVDPADPYDPPCFELKTHGKRAAMVRTCGRCQPVLLSESLRAIHPIKPDRSHHCRQTGRCVLDMDHYCPWVGNCIGFRNRKYFLLLLLYTEISLTLLIIWTAPQVAAATTNRYAMVMGLPLLLLVAAALGLWVLTGIFLGYHLQLAWANMTTVEYFEKRKDGIRPDDPDLNSLTMEQRKELIFRPVKGRKAKPGDAFVTMWKRHAYHISPYDRGSGCANLRYIFGSNVLLWWLPVRWFQPEWSPSSRLSVTPRAKMYRDLLLLHHEDLAEAWRRRR